MRKTWFLLVLILMLLVAVSPVQAASFPQTVEPPQEAQTAATQTGFPWLALLVFVAAGVIMMVIKRQSSPNTITVNACAPLIDEEKMERERQKIAELEGKSPKS